MFELSSEEKVILLSSRLRPSADDFESIKNLLQESDKHFDCNKMVKLASLNGVAPFLYVNMKDIDIVPADVKEALSKSYYSTIARNTVNLKETLRILKLLDNHGIEAVPLKGSLASELIFSNPGLYSGSDIDILVKPSKIEQVRKILTKSGYQYNKDSESAMLASHYHISFYNEKHTIEVHWNLVKRYFHIPPEFWWEDSFTVPFQGIEMRCLSQERYLLYLVFRLFSHQFHPLKFLVLTAEHIKVNNERIDWGRLFTYAARYRMRRLLLFSCHLLSELLGINIENLSRYGSVIGYTMLRRKVLQGLFRNPSRPFIRKVYYLALLDTYPQIAAGFIRRFIPSKAELSLRYDIPKDSLWIYLYYLLNIILLPRMIFRKGTGL